MLLWIIHHYRAERIIKTKYRETKVVNYRQENDRLVLFLTVMSAEQTMMDK